MLRRDHTQSIRLAAVLLAIFGNVMVAEWDADPVRIDGYCVAARGVVVLWQRSLGALARLPVLFALSYVLLMGFALLVLIAVSLPSCF